jgi:drug/metabolite transporter (DMT)-like permease
MTLPFSWLEWPRWNPATLLNLPVVLSVLYLGIISTAVAFFSWNKGLALLPSHQAGLFFFFQPVVGSLLGWLVLNETLTPSFFLGSLLILGGVYLIVQQEPETGLKGVKEAG